MNTKVSVLRTWTNSSCVNVFSMLFSTCHSSTQLSALVPVRLLSCTTLREGLAIPVSHIILVCGFVVIFELSILAFCKGPDVTELLEAYEHNLGPVDKDEAFAVENGE